MPFLWLKCRRPAAPTPTAACKETRCCLVLLQGPPFPPARHDRQRPQQQQPHAQTRPELPAATSPESRTQLQHPAAQQTEAPLPYSLSPPFPLSLLPVCPCIRPLSENKAEESGPRDPVFVAGSLLCSFALQKSPSFSTHPPLPLPALVSPSFAKGTAYA